MRHLAAAPLSAFAVLLLLTGCTTLSTPVSVPTAPPLFSPGSGSYTTAQTVTISDATPGAAIYYTTDGTTPTTSKVYSGTLAVTSNETIEAVAVAAGYAESAVAVASYSIAVVEPVAATPVIAPGTGTYTSAQTVTISDATPGATIYYTTNGTTPTTTSSSLYAGAITVASNETIEAIAAATGYTNSTVAAAVFSIATPVAATPVFSPAGGSYSSSQSVTITDGTAGVAIYYTMNGTTPTTSSTLYQGAITVASSETIEAIAMASGYANSQIATATYTIGTTGGASNGQWTWMAGSNAVNPSEVFGTMGVASPSNEPGSTSEATSMVDSSGGFWLFGGDAFGVHNDLWYFDTANNEWTWVNGSGQPSSSGSYGTQGVASATNLPPGRAEAAGWGDKTGNLWVFGGIPISSITNNVLNDLWKYNIASKQWTWVTGSNVPNASPVFGMQGVAATANTPGNLAGVADCTDIQGNFWLFGGSNNLNTQGTPGLYNTLWKFNPTTSQWTWVSGATSTNASGVYGLEGVATASNVPGARTSAACWVDVLGNLWLFGGFGFDSSATASNFMQLNDLWKFNPVTLQWTWVSGSSTRNALGSYGAEGVAAPTNVPPARQAAATWVDDSGQLWLFGGDVINAAATGAAVGNDLWVYSSATGYWTWVAGSSTTGAVGVYGALGVSSASSMPGARDSAVWWVDSQRDFWLMGGIGLGNSTSMGYLDDVWRYQP
jgi:hypothetical protein